MVDEISISFLKRYSSFMSKAFLRASDTFIYMLILKVTIQFNKSLSRQLKLKSQAYILITPAGICLHGLRISTGLEWSVAMVCVEVACSLPGLYKDSFHIAIVEFNRHWKK